MGSVFCMDHYDGRKRISRGFSVLFMICVYGKAKSVSFIYPGR